VTPQEKREIARRAAVGALEATRSVFADDAAARDAGKSDPFAGNHLDVIVPMTDEQVIASLKRQLVAAENEVATLRETVKQGSAMTELERELLAALKALLGVDNPPAGEPGHIDYGIAVRIAAAVVARAEGK
jgi:hypothetical protein